MDAHVSYSSESELYGTMCCLCDIFEYVSIIVRLRISNHLRCATFFAQRLKIQTHYSHAHVSYSSESELYGTMCCLCVIFEYVNILVRLRISNHLRCATFFAQWLKIQTHYSHATRSLSLDEYKRVEYSCFTEGCSTGTIGHRPSPSQAHALHSCNRSTSCMHAS